MIFWDSSAVIPLLVDEPATRTARDLLRRDRALLVFWATEVECLSALARREREGSLAPAAAERARQALRALRPSWSEVVASDDVRGFAGRLLRRHPLRAGDVLQLSAAMVWARGRPDDHAFATLDERLARAAVAEGFRLALAP